jgi:hypothetical protein
MEQYSEQSADRSMDQDDGRWLTYPELAAVRGIDKPSAIRLATRKKWRRQRDNRRVVRVLVPSEWLAPRYQSMDLPMEQQGGDMDLSSDLTTFAAALAAVEAAHAGEVAALYGQIDGLKTLADSATARLMDAEAAQSGLHDQLTKAETTAGELRVELDQARTEAQAAQDRVDKLTRAYRRLFSQRLQRNLCLQPCVNRSSRPLCHGPLRLSTERPTSNYTPGPKFGAHFSWSCRVSIAAGRGSGS